MTPAWRALVVPLLAVACAVPVRYGVPGSDLIGREVPGSDLTLRVGDRPRRVTVQAVEDLDGRDFLTSDDGVATAVQVAARRSPHTQIRLVTTETSREGTLIGTIFGALGGLLLGWRVGVVAQEGASHDGGATAWLPVALAATTTALGATGGFVVGLVSSARAIPARAIPQPAP